MINRRTTHWFLALAAAWLLAGNALAAAPESSDIDPDPMEPLNRAIFSFNRGLDKVLLRPVTVGYRAVMPDKGREMVSNALANIYTPVTFANSVLQGDVTNSFTSFWRFVINTTVGVGGLFDVASQAGLKPRTTDLGQTFALWGADPGPYVVIPIIGPSSTRDSFGRLGDVFLNPFNYIDEGVSLSIWSATAIDKRSSNMKLIDGIYNDSLDPYATVRSAWTQKRANDIKRAREARDKALENLQAK